MISTSLKNILNGTIAIGLSLALYGCGGSSKGTTSTGPLGQQSDITISGTKAGITPFITSVQLTGASVADVTAVNSVIAAKPNTVSKPVSVTWNRGSLAERGYLNGTAINLPVFGLYADYSNQVTINVSFTDGSTQQLQSQVITAPYVDASGVYSSPTIVQPRAAGSSLGYDFMFLKSLLGSPVIIDTDAEIRWAVPAEPDQAVYFTDGQIYEGSPTSSKISILQMDGTSTTLQTSLTQPAAGNGFTHNLDPSPGGFLAEFGNSESALDYDDLVVDIAPFPGTAPLQSFDMAEILSSYMQANGDDPTAFVRTDADWFHVNASTYDPSDKTVIISSRENFLIKVNYATRDIVWILGDPTKYWYTFPSLRAKALTLNAGGDYPIGQHATSITAEGYLMVMNDGYGSMNAPAGTSAGLSRTFSEVSAYTIDTSTMTAQNVWNFNYGQSIYSPICGSAYQAGGSYLLDFATSSNYTQARLVGLDSNKNVAFDFQYNSPAFCSVGWNATPIPMENMSID